jgi:hypothetical protein
MQLKGFLVEGNDLITNKILMFTQLITSAIRIVKKQKFIDILLKSTTTAFNYVFYMVQISALLIKLVAYSSQGNHTGQLDFCH